MANGTTRQALAEIQLSKESAQSENEQMKKLDKQLPKKFPLKNPSEHNHSK